MSEIEIRSCGFLILRTIDDSTEEFLLMKHSKRWDLPKGHVDPGETEMECALRELWEETSIKDSQIQIVSEFVFKQQYTVRRKKNGRVPQLKELVIFLATLTEDVEIQCTEHEGYQWWPWNPPHKIQDQTIDPLLAHLENFRSSTSR